METAIHQSWYVNPNNRSCTSNLKNTVIKDPGAFYSSMQNLLNPVEDMAQELKAPARRADSGAAAAYEKMKADNSTYTFADEKTRNQIAYISDYYLGHTTEKLKNAWQQTLEATGINPFPQGFFSTLSQLSMEQDFATGGDDDIFGSDLESNRAAVEKILDRIENPAGRMTEKRAEFLEKEKRFYTALLNCLV